MELVFPALISSIATLLAVWLQSFLNKKKSKKANREFIDLINSPKVKKFYVVFKDDDDKENKMFLSKASVAEKNIKLNIKDKKLMLFVEFTEEKHLDYNNMGIIKRYSEKLNERFDNV